MKKSKFTEEQIAYALRQVESDSARRRVPAAGRERSHLLHLEEEIRPPGRQRAAQAAVARGRECAAQTRRCRPHARQAHARGGVEKKGLRPARRRELAAWFQATYGVKVQRAGRLAQFGRTAWYRRSTARDQGPLRLRIRELAHARPRFGFLRIWVLLRREGWRINKKRVRRLYRLEGLQLRMRVRRRKHIALHRGPAPRPAGPTERWSMDFVHDALADGRPFRVLTVVDQWSRQSPMLEVASSMSGHTVGMALDRALTDGTVPVSITVDHGTEFMSRARSRTGPSRAALEAIARYKNIYSQTGGGRCVSELGCATEALPRWVRQAERDQGQRPGPTTDERQQLKAFHRENVELDAPTRFCGRRVFAQAELDRRGK
jgi:hypothetical protein